MAEVNKQVNYKLLVMIGLDGWYQTLAQPPLLRLSSDKIIDLKPENDLKVFFSCIVLLCLTGLAFKLLLKREEGDCSSEGELETSSGIFIPFRGSWSVHYRLHSTQYQIFLTQSCHARLLLLPITETFVHSLSLLSPQYYYWMCQYLQ